MTELGSVEVEKSDLPQLLEYLHEWQQGQRMQIAIVKRDLSAAENGEQKEELLAPSPWELRYQAVENALREIEPDYEPGEPNYELPDIEHHPETGRYCDIANACTRTDPTPARNCRRSKPPFLARQFARRCDRQSR